MAVLPGVSPGMAVWYGVPHQTAAETPAAVEADPCITGIRLGAGGGSFRAMLARRRREMLGRDDLPEELVQVGNAAAVVATTLPAVGRRIARVLGGLVVAGSSIGPLLMCVLRLGLQRLLHPT